VAFRNPSIKILFPLIALSAACAHAKLTDMKLRAIDTFGSKRLSALQVQHDYGTQIAAYSARLDQHQYDEATQLASQIQSSIKSHFQFAYVNISLISYYNAPYIGDYVTIDVVEPEDAPVRLAFSLPPQGLYPDPDGLIDLMDQYFKKGMDLLRSGRLAPEKKCPVWHCMFGFDHPQLASYLEQFNSRVPRHEKELVTILQKDSRSNFRGNAAFLLAHLKNGDSVVKDMLLATRDPVSVVRNNAVRVLALIAANHPEIKIPVDPLLQVLNFPEATDRNKASYAIVLLALMKENAQPIIASGAVLISMLKLQQPNNHDPAYAILKNISGESFGERDYGAWQDWLIKHGTRF